jgi:hypothetical protein
MWLTNDQTVNNKHSRQQQFFEHDSRIHMLKKTCLEWTSRSPSTMFRFTESYTCSTLRLEQEEIDAWFSWSSLDRKQLIELWLQTCPQTFLPDLKVKRPTLIRQLYEKWKDQKEDFQTMVHSLTHITCARTRKKLSTLTIGPGFKFRMMVLAWTCKSVSDFLNPNDTKFCENQKLWSQAAVYRVTRCSPSKTSIHVKMMAGQPDALVEEDGYGMRLLGQSVKSTIYSSFDDRYKIDFAPLACYIQVCEWMHQADRASGGHGKSVMGALAFLVTEYARNDAAVLVPPLPVFWGGTDSVRQVTQTTTPKRGHKRRLHEVVNIHDSTRKKRVQLGSGASV